MRAWGVGKIIILLNRLTVIVTAGFDEKLYMDIINTLCCRLLEGLERYLGYLSFQIIEHTKKNCGVVGR